MAHSTLHSLTLPLWLAAPLDGMPFASISIVNHAGIDMMAAIMPMTRP